MLTAKQYARIQPIMCNKYTTCKGCPLAELTKKSGYNNCFTTRVMSPAACVDLVEEWWKENREFVWNKYTYINDRNKDKTQDM